jgi:nicotinamide riboside kinase
MKIAIVGPESSGKPTLARDLAAALHAPWVAEYVREYFADKG